LIKDHHEGYITWEQFERNQKVLSENNFMLTGSTRKAGRGGHGLLTGLLRCRRCGRCSTPTIPAAAIWFVTPAEE
jgi:hypothetical protein